MDCLFSGSFSIAVSTRLSLGSAFNSPWRAGATRARHFTKQRQHLNSTIFSLVSFTSSHKNPKDLQAWHTAAMKVYVVSDLHTDHKENMEWVEDVSKKDHTMDTLLVAGDVADSLKIFKITIEALKKSFRHVFLVPGNHDLWCRRREDPQNSLEKLEAINDCCREAGVETAPKLVDDVWIVPLLSWHHQSFDAEQDIEGYNIPPLSKACMDYRVCKWPPHLNNADDSLAQHFDNMNNPLLDDLIIPSPESSQIISFSHFLPRHELCPEKRMLFYPHLPKMIGSTWLERRIRSIHGDNGSSNACHVFGHTHFAWDQTLDGIRYMQLPLGYPKERERILKGNHGLLPLLIYDSENGGLIPEPVSCHWSDYYKTHEREPSNTTLAPWVSKMYRPREDVLHKTPEL